MLPHQSVQINRQMPLGQWPIDQQILIINHISDQSFPQQVMLKAKETKGSEPWRPEQVFDYRLRLHALSSSLLACSSLVDRPIL